MDVTIAQIPLLITLKETAFLVMCMGGYTILCVLIGFAIGRTSKNLPLGARFVEREAKPRDIDQTSGMKPYEEPEGDLFNDMMEAPPDDTERRIPTIGGMA